MTKNWKWYFSIWHPRQMLTFGIEWVADKSWFRGLTEFDIYLGPVAFGWLKMPEPVETIRKKK